MTKPAAVRALKTCAVLLLAGAVLYPLLAQSLYYPLLPPALEGAGKLVFRLAFWAVFPVLLAFSLAIGSIWRHWTPGGWAFCAIVTPWFYWTIWQCLRWLRGLLAMDAPAEADATADPAPPLIPADPGRRAFLRRGLLAGGAALAGGGACAHAVLVEPQNLEVRRHRIAILNLPPALDGLRVLQIADTHLGPFVSLAYLQSVMRRANELKPDLILLVGDYVYRSRGSIEAGIGLFAGLKAPLGIAAVLGNHDHYEGAAACRRAFARIGVPLIDNSRLFLDARGLREKMPDADQCVCIGGVGDLWEDAVRPDLAFAGVPREMPRILLSHNPDVAEEIGGKHRIDLMLSGHTHGGQVSLPFVGPLFLPSSFSHKYAGGVCAGPACPVIVSRGVGMTVLPVRFRVPPELVEITLLRREKTESPES